ncbi:hypothetical protein D1B33_06665 [Lysinibacillus yapensis]|uniref:YqfQ-like protein n=1 Tax=Ureibacillus yapensis TaxID=2304605 RepID=A0A396SBS8_9BACL|nr:VrrA/YqfQ family protein [Lysinibacillus yapensis]RHW38553.1 hypothetical protein D1B33_06665 [Lysinibacillus yapensis]
MRPQSFRQPMPNGRPFNHMQGPRNNFGPRPARFMQPGMMQPPGYGPGPMQGPGFAQKGVAPKLESFMDTANRFLATAQSFTPIVQQATPMFRNLPVLWKLYKGFQGLPKNSESKDYDSREKRPKQSEREFEKGARPKNFERREREGLDRARNRNREVYAEDLTESTIDQEFVKPRKTPRPSMPKIFQPDYHFDE